MVERYGNPASVAVVERLRAVRGGRRAPRAALAWAKAATREPDRERSLRLAALGQLECVRATLGVPG
ncbi:hypothetical protein Ae406Ps2_1265c [Pseudonocardia sp. Ae406_Ps2]|nr:hypothetical protein Ae406Ps2_1265c [Pseudonocardia sp. Ae406_Ps2]OLM06938.1 hypothetical protein Ae331Ps2_4648 [Pseudonocardia sp. Ae331_Ps2]OLM14114.1 hypothetical protein Ae505Ps2_4244 [Pseudonocardia sp. Ae505_Ps2]OLM22839.1 hypothetical protein Ae706Ps2_1271c [Pseudonocardia sp. Ae706_Ps2]